MRIPRQHCLSNMEDTKGTTWFFGRKREDSRERAGAVWSCPWEDTEKRHERLLDDKVLMLGAL